jgi:hypothetical protein
MPQSSRGLAVALAFLLGCSHSNKGASSGNGTDDGGAGSGSGDGPNFGFQPTGGGSGNGGGTSGGGASGANGGGGTSGLGPLPPGCAEITVQGERLPIDLYMMIDTSASMLQKTADGPTKWDAVRAALTSFFNDQASAGIGVGVQFFPKITGSTKDCTSDAACGAFAPCFGIRTCSGLGYIQPCATAADCSSGATCDLFGYCNATKEFCQGIGTPCGGGKDTCAGDTVGGYCLGRDSCTVGDYATPAVGVAPLPGSAGDLTKALMAQTPDGYTPTSAALSGALQQARALAAAANGRKTAVVLATDGLPTSCAPKDIGGVAALAAQGVAGTPSIPTFVIGVFAPEEQGAAANLDQLAASGGTTSARIVNGSQNTTASFLAALDDIRATAVSCEFKIPASTAKGPVDYGNVNVAFTSGAGVQDTIPNVPARAQCPAGGDGWYYDVDPTMGTPTKIETCDATCARLRADPKGRIDILIGCKTIVIK